MKDEKDQVTEAAESKTPRLKLEINRESVRQLSEDDLGIVAGGTGSAPSGGCPSASGCLRRVL